nr:hypothetical protein B0A51_10785 [Rachicladosporium sp. CCFEE 5018]
MTYASRIHHDQWRAIQLTKRMHDMIDEDDKTLGTVLEISRMHATATSNTARLCNEAHHSSTSVQPAHGELDLRNFSDGAFCYMCCVLASPWPSDTNLPEQLTSGTELRLEPESILYVGADGVLRSVNAEHTAVLDYIRLSPA